MQRRNDEPNLEGGDPPRGGSDESSMSGSGTGLWRADPLSQGIACIVIWASGADTRLDGVVRIAAVRRGPGGTWESMEETCQPFRGEPSGATKRLRQEFGVDARDLEGRPAAVEIWPSIREFIGDRPVVAHDGALVASWAMALDENAGLPDKPLDPIGLDEIALLLEPGAVAALGPPQLVRALVDPMIAPSPHGALQPPHVLAALAELVARYGDLGRPPSPCARSDGCAPTRSSRARTPVRPTDSACLSRSSTSQRAGAATSTSSRPADSATV